MEAVQDRFMAEEDTAVAERLVGVEGAWVSEAADVVKVLSAETPRLPEASRDLTQ